MRRRRRQSTAIVLLLSQLLLVVGGGPFMVQCRAANGHAAIELAHANPCDGGIAPGSTQFTHEAHDAAPDTTTRAVSDAPQCVDTSLAQPTLLRQDNRFEWPATPVLFAFTIAEFPAIPTRYIDAPSHLFSPDSAGSLARNIILLI